MKKIWLLLGLVILGFTSSCSSPPKPNEEMQKHLLNLSSPPPPPPVRYTKTVDAYFVQGEIDWSKISESHIATTTLSQHSRTEKVGIPLTVQSAYNGKEIFFKVSWAEKEPQVTSDIYTADRLAFNWNVSSDSFDSQGCGPACHFWSPPFKNGKIAGMWLPEKDALVDDWFWAALNANGGKGMDRNLTGKPRIISHGMNMPGMSGAAPHIMKVAYYEQSSPSMLRFKASHENGAWTVEVSRPLLTRNPREVQFKPKKHPFYIFGMSVFPGTMYHDYSGVLYVHFLNR